MISSYNISLPAGTFPNSNSKSVVTSSFSQSTDASLQPSLRTGSATSIPGVGFSSVVSESTAVAAPEPRVAQSSSPRNQDNQISVSNQEPEALVPPNQDEDDSFINAREDSNREVERGSDPRSGLNDREIQVVEELKLRDQEVRAHERAHQAVGGQYTGDVAFSFQTGPDGKRYAVGGEVPIDVSPIPGNPQATIDKMRVVKSAALAPADPSPQDRNVAATATRLLLEAQIELAAERRDSSTASGPSFDFSQLVSKSYEEIIGLDNESSRTFTEQVDERV